MTITKTIGGDRLGSGNQMKQSMHNFERSNHDLGYLWRSSMASGTLVPFLFEPMLPGDTFDIKLNTKTLTHPTIGPMLGSYKLQLDVFTIPIRLYQAQLHNNKVGIGMDMRKIILPIVQCEANNIDWKSNEPIDLQQINPSSLLRYLGKSGFGSKVPSDTGKKIVSSHPALGELMYYDIVKNYFTNKQEGIAAIIDYEDLILPERERAAMTYINNNNQTVSVTLPTEGEVIPFRAGLTIWGSGLSAEIIVIRYKDPNDEEGEILEMPFAEGCSVVVNEESVVDGIAKTNVGEPLRDMVIIDLVIREEAITMPTPQITTFPIKNFDDMREDILADIKSEYSFKITKDTYAPYGNSYKKIIPDRTGSKLRCYLPMQGLALKTYQSDLYNNWLNDEWISGSNGIAEITAIDVSEGLLKLDTLNLQQKVYNMLSRIALSGGTYYDWLEAAYGQKAMNMAETPVYQGGLSKEIVFNEIISNAESGENPLGTLAGKGVQTDKHKGGYINVKADEHSYVMGIVSITPRIDYSQGNAWHMENLITMDDFHKPNLDQIGYQDLITDQMAAWDTKIEGTEGNRKRTFSAGKLPAWMNYMTNVNKCFGNFADENNEMFMTLNRRYEANRETGRIKDLTTYIDPEKYNYIFAQLDRSAQNFWIQIDVAISARRKVSARQIPNL